MADVNAPANTIHHTPLSTIDENAEMSPQERLADLTAKALAQYSVKQYSLAAELYSQATELQAGINGEMAVENADLLYDYGKCLFYLAQQTSSVLGGTAASAQLSSKEKKEPKKRKIQKTNGAAAGEGSSSAATTEPNTEANVGDIIQTSVVEEDRNPTPDKPFFHIEGDENFENSDEDDDDQEAAADDEEEEEEEDDDFVTAYELLDLSRVLYLKKLDQLQQSSLEDSTDKGMYVASIDLTPPVQATKRRIADIYDLQSEISLEGEKYSTAVTDLQACLALKEELETPESSLLAECHYKLSLALEFSSQTQQRDADGNPVGELVVDWTVRNEAIAQQERAIDCCKLRILREKASLESLPDGKEKDKTMVGVEDVQEMITEMEDRLKELRKEPVSVKEATEPQKEEIMGVLGSILGGEKSMEEVTKSANDLSGLVKRKKPKAEDGTAAVDKGKGKRKVDLVGELEDGASKKAKVEETEDGLN